MSVAGATIPAMSDFDTAPDPADLDASQVIDGELAPQSDQDIYFKDARLASLLVHYRELAGYSQEQLASAAKVERSNISKIERGVTTNPWPGTIDSLARAMAVRIPGSHHQRIADHLTTAKNNKPEVLGLDPEAIVIADMITAYPPPLRRLLYQQITAILKLAKDIIKKARELNF